MYRTGKLCIITLSIFLVFAPLSLAAGDFGLLLTQIGGVGGSGNESDSDYEISLLPRFLNLFGDSGELYISASLRAAYENEDWRIVPELLRTDFSWSLGNYDFRLGRMVYLDPMSLIAVGLFDGASISYHHAVHGTFGFGLWYTGLLYKNRANISMTPGDAYDMAEELNWNNFADTYFASRRLIAALHWEHPSFMERMMLNAALLCQFDLNNRAVSYHSQYLIARAAMPFGRFIFELGGALEYGQWIENSNTYFQLAFAADFGVRWLPPLHFDSMLSFTGRFTSPDSGSFSAFTPVTALSFGDILRTEISGISFFALSYIARIHHTSSVEFSVMHFIRSDNVTYTAYPVTEPTNNRSLGTELFGRFTWSPASDLNLNFGAGAFLPALGNVAPDANARWRIELSVTLGLL